MKIYKLISSVFYGVVCVGVYAQANTEMQAPSQLNLDSSTITLESLMNPVSQASTGISDLRIRMLTEAGKTVGFRGGLIDRSRSLMDALKSRSDSLNKIFQFSSLISKNGTTPPVIVEAQDVSSFSVDQIRMASRVYKIEKEERFVSVPPTWRDYLFVGLPVNDVVDMPHLDARPQNNNEQILWKSAVKQGWHEGHNQANAILSANFNRLIRDYSGMLRYSTLLQQGMISETKTAETQQTVTGDTKQITLGDTLRRVVSKAGFEPDAKKWRPTISKALIPEPIYTPLDNFSERWNSLGLGGVFSPTSNCSNDKRITNNNQCLSKNGVLTYFEFSRVWTLSKDKTLKENLTDWTDIAGWKNPIWDADNPYQVASTISIRGTFIEVLERISQSIPGIDIHVSKVQRSIRVSDRN